MGMTKTVEIIKRLRSSPHSLSQVEISRLTGIPQPRVSRWEAGHVAAGADDALRLASLEQKLEKQRKSKAA